MTPFSAKYKVSDGINSKLAVKDIFPFTTIVIESFNIPLDQPVKT